MSIALDYAKFKSSGVISIYEIDEFNIYCVISEHSVQCKRTVLNYDIY